MSDNALAVVDAEIVVGDALHQLQRAEIDTQIATAHTYPRNVKAFMNDAVSMATLDQETAEACSYNLTRGGKSIQGPSVRLAEIAASCWGNMRYGSRVVDVTDTHVVAQGFAHDLQRNVAYTTEVMRRITDRNGRRYSDDMITVTANAACSIACRNAIFKVIPGAYINQIRQAALRTAVGEAKPLAEQRQEVLKRLMDRFRVDEARALAAVNKQSVGDLTQEDIHQLIGLGSAIKDGATTIEEAFPLPAPESPADLADRVMARSKSGKKPAKPSDKDADNFADDIAGRMDGGQAVDVHAEPVEK